MVAAQLFFFGPPQLTHAGGRRPLPPLFSQAKCPKHVAAIVAFVYLGYTPKKRREVVEVVYFMETTSTTSSPWTIPGDGKIFWASPFF